MKKWLMATSMTAMLTFAPMSTVLAQSACQHNSCKQHIHQTLYPINAAMQPADAPEPGRRFEIQSSVQVPRDALRQAFEASQKAYTEKLQKFAKISAAQAQKVVISEHPGMKVAELQLRNIRTSLVYMAIIEDDEDKYLVVVDAGNGKILMDKPLPTHHTKVFAGSGE